MSIDNQPMNVYWSGKRTKTSNTFKITDKGSVAEYTDLPSSGNQKGDKYEVTDDGSDYIWDGSAWSRLGAEKYAYEDIVNMPDFALDTNVVHKTDDENIAGVKTLESNPKVSNDSPGITLTRTGDDNTNASTILSFNKSQSTVLTCVVNDSENTSLNLRYNKSTAPSKGASIGLNSGGSFSFKAQKGNNSTAYLLVGDGDGSLQWNGQEIQTASDARLKTEVSLVPDAVLDAWGAVQWGQFQFLASVNAKGLDNARHHVGLIAQDVKEVFKNNALDACAYGILCHVDRPETEESPAVEMWTIRYAEALAMEAACQRRRADRLEARIAALEALVGGGRQ